jgi:glyoxylase-like metal-dependent hydrolase (beta-lactamase superfamily II)/8-oxo-dGTP pyrophosphatase MutT (NUDIX family)
LILARDGEHGLEVFMMERTHQADFLAGAYVFPGGAVDRSDSDAGIAGRCVNMDDACASRRLHVARDGLSFWIAAIRECFEESGLLLAYDDDHDDNVGGKRELLSLDDPQAVERYSEWREKLVAGSATFLEVCESANLRLAVDRLAFFGHWITPVDRPKRFDTRFFVAIAPPKQAALPDYSEMVSHLWIRPSDALRLQEGGKLNLAFATIKTLEALAAHRDANALMDHARSLEAIMPFTPRAATGRSGRRLLLPADAAYAEVSLLDTGCDGSVSCELVPGKVTTLFPQVRRIAAPNPSMMTGPGTNTYILGSGDDVAVIDPGPPNEEHIAALLAAVEGNHGRIRSILVTHTHIDHSPAAAILRMRTGAQVLGMPPAYPDRQDPSFRPDRALQHGERVTVGGCTLRVLHTPGHASNHLCYLLEEERLLFTGDHIMQGSTVIINPPDGDMAAYLRSLRRLKEEDIRYLAPGHGFLMDNPHEVIDRLLRHRLAREDKALHALPRHGHAAIEDLVPLVYDDVPPQKHRAAARSLLAHLIKLKADGRAIEVDGRWRAP